MTAYADAERLADERDRGDRWRYRARKAEAERDALRVRIAETERRLNRWATSESQVAQMIVAEARGALAGDQPEATPEPDDIPGGCIYCSSSGIVEDYEGDRPCSACDGTGTPRLREVTPEPPHLDPEPWVCRCGCGNRYLLKDHFLTMVFDPHPADENGKPYSDNIEHYKKEI